MPSNEAGRGENEAQRLQLELIRLRDLPGDYWNVDRLYLVAEPGREAALEALARTWLADEVVWLDGRVAQIAMGGHWRREPQVLIVWWD